MFGFPVAALVITAPPYEWPTSTTGPGSVSRKARTYAASPDSDRSGLATAATVYPSLCSGATTLLQLEASAQAPCTRTITGFDRPPSAWASVWEVLMVLSCSVGRA